MSNAVSGTPLSSCQRGVVTMDGGTTHTRLSLWRPGGGVVARVRLSLGCRDVARDGRTGLQAEIRQAVQGWAESPPAGVAPALLLGSGMITSPQGLVTVPHVPAPAGLTELAQAMQQSDLPELNLPCWWIGGIKCVPTPAALEPMAMVRGGGAVASAPVDGLDMMRGEEVEAVALAARLGLRGPALIALPGSHSKYLLWDVHDRIARSWTTLAGEMLQALTEHTLVRASVEGRFATVLDEGALRAGAALSRSQGLGRAAFGLRLLEHLGSTGTSTAAAKGEEGARNARACWLLGAVLADDLRLLEAQRLLGPDRSWTVAGQALLRDGLSLLLRDAGCAVHIVPDALQADLSGAGALRVAAMRGLLPPGFDWPMGQSTVTTDVESHPAMEALSR
jgi:2-dehydro-3-deoxygalactonokinase